MHVAPSSLAPSARPCMVGAAMSLSNWLTQDQTTEGYKANWGDSAGRDDRGLAHRRGVLREGDAPRSKPGDQRLHPQRRLTAVLQFNDGRCRAGGNGKPHHPPGTFLSSEISVEGWLKSEISIDGHRGPILGITQGFPHARDEHSRRGARYLSTPAEFPQALDILRRGAIVGDIRPFEQRLERLNWKWRAALADNRPGFSLDLGVDHRRRMLTVAPDAQLEPVTATLAMPAQKCELRRVEIQRSDPLLRP